MRLIEEFLTGERSAAAVPVDRLLSTLLFNDIVRSTDRAADLGDARWREVLVHFDGCAARGGSPPGCRS